MTIKMRYHSFLLILIASIAVENHNLYSFCLSSFIFIGPPRRSYQRTNRANILSRRIHNAENHKEDTQAMIPRGNWGQSYCYNSRQQNNYVKRQRRRHHADRYSEIVTQLKSSDNDDGDDSIDELSIVYNNSDEYDDDDSDIKSDVNGDDDDDESYSEKFSSDNRDKEINGSNNGSGSSSSSSNEPLDETQRRIEEQQQQIDLLMKLVQSDDKLPTSNDGSPQQQSSSITSDETPPTSTISQQPLGPSLVPLKAMLFIDGTWLYYSIYGRDEARDVIVQKYGRHWHNQYKINWSMLPRMICEQLQKQETETGWNVVASGAGAASGSGRPVDIVRALVFTSMKNDTHKFSNRAQMFEDMSAANYDVHMMQTVGKGEKCIDIQLAVEMLHFATVPNAYDIAILLSGDKDFMPALVRTRQKGCKVAIASMRPGCNRALYETPNVKDYDVIWIEDHLDDLLIPLGLQGHRAVDTSNRPKISRFTLNKVLYDFIDKSGFDKVSSRDVGRYLKTLEIKSPDGEESLSILDEIKLGYGNMFQFLLKSGCFLPEVRDDSNYAADKSFLVKMDPDAKKYLLIDAKQTKFADEEKDFFNTYSLQTLEDNRDSIYFHTLNPQKAGKTPLYVQNDNDSGSGDEETEELELPEELTKDYTQCTVAALKDRCRERGLQVSGTKAVLIERVQNDVEEQIKELRSRQLASVGATKQSTAAGRAQYGSGGRTYSPDVRTFNRVSPEVTRHLEELVREYLQARGGQSSSRDIGRYLNANKSHNQRSRSALTELKEEYGSLSNFLNARTSSFERGDIKESSASGDLNYGFPVRLRR